MKKKQKNIQSKNYHDYVIKDGKFIGKFEEMYKNVADPWHHGNAEEIQYDIILYLIDKYKICSGGGKILDIGCGKGAFTSRMKKQVPKTNILGIDISQTAIKKAENKYGDRALIFRHMDIRKRYNKISGKFDLITVSDVMWYILPDFKKIINSLRKNLKENGYLLIKQVFYQPGQQKYGNKIVSSFEDMLDLINYKVIEMVELNRFRNHYTITLFKKK